MAIRRIFAGIVLFLSLSHVYANPYMPYPPPQMPESPGLVLQQGIEQLTDFLASRGNPDAPPIEMFLENTIAPFFDFSYMARWTAGPRARFMNAQQGAELEQKLRRLFMSAMVDKLSEYRYARVHYLPPIGSPQEGNMTFSLLAFQQDDPMPQRLSFNMYLGNNGWKIYDVSANGHSALAFFRTQFAIEERQRGR